MSVDYVCAEVNLVCFLVFWASVLLIISHGSGGHRSRLAAMMRDVLLPTHRVTAEPAVACLSSWL
jgi:hypothetical protein